MKAFIKLSDTLTVNVHAIACWEIEAMRMSLIFPNGRSCILTGEALDGFKNWSMLRAVEAYRAPANARFVRVSERFGFNTHRLLMFGAGEAESLVLSFGSYDHVLYQRDAVAFLNWIERVRGTAPVTHQPAMFG